MKKLEIDLTSERFHPVWLFVGALIGRAAGLELGLNLGFWYFADPAAVIVWEVLGVFSGALFFSFMMTSSADMRLKGAILGLGIGFSTALYGGEIWAAFQHRAVRGLTGMSVAEGIFFEWVLMHASWLGCAVGWITGAAIRRRGRRPVASGEAANG